MGIRLRARFELRCETTKPIKPPNSWNHETYEPRKPLKQNPWNLETDVAMSPMKPRNPCNYEIKKLIKLRNVCNQETYETTKLLNPRSPWKYGTYKARNPWNQRSFERLGFLCLL